MTQIDITYILNARWPTVRAYGLQVAKMCQGFKQTGAKVRLLVPWRALHRELRDLTPAQIYGIRDEFRIIRLPSMDFARMYSNNKSLFLIQQAFFATFSAIYLLFRPSQVVYSRDPFTLYFLSFIRKDLYWEMHRMPEDMNRFVYKRIIRCVRGIVVISHGIRDRLVSYGYTSDRVFIAPDGIDLEEQGDDNVATSIAREKRLVVYTGQLLDWKGVGVLVDAAQLLDDAYIVVIVGGQPSEIALLRKSDTGGRIVFTGFVPHARALGWMRAAQVLVLPNLKDGSISEFYTSPLKMFEYMASGNPIVASDLPSLREVLNDRNAVFVVPGDAASLAQGIMRAAAEKGRELARCAREDVVNYTWENRAKRIIEFIYQ